MKGEAPLPCRPKWEKVHAMGTTVLELGSPHGKAAFNLCANGDGLLVAECVTERQGSASPYAASFFHYTLHCTFPTELAMAWRPPGPIQGTARYDDLGAQPGMQRPLGPGPVNDVFLNAGSEFIKSGFGAYLGTGREYVQSNVSRLFLGHDLAYYFQVNDVYVKNKLKVLLFPFRHKGNWTRIAEQVAGGLKYKPPKYDINAPDLYIPLMAFTTYIVLCGYASGLLGKFSPADLNRSFSSALIGWAAEALLLRCLLFAMSSGDVPVLDIVAYSGYAFVGVSLCILATIKPFLYYTILLWTGLCLAIFLVKTMKRILFADARAFDRDSSKHHYLLLFMAALQWPLFLWLSYINSSKA